MLTENEYELTVRPDTNAKRYRVWFHFSVANWKPNQKVLFHVNNFSKSKSLYKDGMSPIFRARGNEGNGGIEATSTSTSGNDSQWERVHPKNVFYYRSKEGVRVEKLKRTDSLRSDDSVASGDGSGDETGEQTKRPRKPHTLSWTHVFPSTCDDGETVEFAYSYPFTVSEQQNILDELDAKNLPHVHRRILTHSLQGRRCDVVVVDGGDDKDAPAGTSLSPRRVVFMTCRVHPGETPSSHALFGLMNFVVSDHPHAQQLRKKVTFVFVPMLNPDGCFAGNYRADSMGKDLNRHWRDPSEKYEPTLYHVKLLIKWYARDPCHELDFFIDAHAHTNSKASFLYCNPPMGSLDSSDEEGSSEDEQGGGTAAGADITAAYQDSKSSKHSHSSDESDVTDEMSNVEKLALLHREKCEFAFKWERAAALPKLMELNCGASLGFSLATCRFCENPEKAGAGRRAVGAMLRRLTRDDLETTESLGDTKTNCSLEDNKNGTVTPNVTPRLPPVTLGLNRGPGAMMCYTLEMSFYGINPNRRNWSAQNSNEIIYNNFGKGLAYSFLDYYGLRRDSESENVINKVINSAATGDVTHPDRMFGGFDRNGLGAAELREKELVNFVVSSGEKETSDNSANSKDKDSNQMPWLRSSFKDKDKRNSTTPWKDKTQRSAGNSQKTLSRKNSGGDKNYKPVKKVVDLADVSRAIANGDGELDGSLGVVTAKMVGGVTNGFKNGVTPGKTKTSRTKSGREKNRKNADAKTENESDVQSSTAPGASFSTLKMETLGSDLKPQNKGIGGGQFKGTGLGFNNPAGGGAGGGKLGRSSSLTKMLTSNTRSNSASKTLLGSFRVPGLGAFGHGSKVAGAKGVTNGSYEQTDTETFGLAADFERAEIGNRKE